MIIYRGNVYFDREDVQQLKDAPRYVRLRYHAIVITTCGPARVPRNKAAVIAELSERQFIRVLRRYEKEGIPGIHYKSRRPKTSPNKTPPAVEKVVLDVRRATGFGSLDTAHLSNIILKHNGHKEQVNRTTAYNIFARNGEVAAEKRKQDESKPFEWGRPNQLIQSDLTEFNGVPIFTGLDDHSRKLWAGRIPDEYDDTIVCEMERVLPSKFDNLLTDNGPQFSRANSAMRVFCEKHVREKHIWSSPHHPQTLGKLGVQQKSLKRFLRHRLGNAIDFLEMDRLIAVYTDYVNNCRWNRRTGCSPEERYSGRSDANAAIRLLATVKLWDFIPMFTGG